MFTGILKSVNLTFLKKKKLGGQVRLTPLGVKLLVS